MEELGHMSLLDEALACQGSRYRLKYCTLAGAISEMEDVDEVVELLASSEVRTSIKFEILQDKGVQIAESTLGKKINKGCECEWCSENFGTEGFVK
jgi:hypothetical protein